MTPVHRTVATAAVLLLWSGALAAQTKDTTVADTSGLAALRAAAAGATATSDTVPHPQTAKLGANALNPEISVTGDLRQSYFHPGPQSDNFVAREFEVGFQSALDPFSTAKITLSVEDGVASVEEGYLYFTALPGHLRLDLGQFRQQVGELNRWHLHAVPEDEYPLVIRRYSSGDGLVAPGASLYWPLPFSGKAGTYELTVQATSSDDSLLFHGSRRPAVNAQLSGFWQLSRSTFAQVSVSGLHGTVPDTGLTTNLTAVAARFTWRPPQQGQAKEVTLRSEVWALDRKFDVNPTTKTRYGGYADATWKFDRRWTAGVRGDYVQSPDPVVDAHEWAVTPSLTWWESEFVFIRGLYEHSRTVANTNTDRVTMQVVFAMGPHKHELF